MNDIKKTLQSQRSFFATGKTKDLAFRIRQLHRLRDSVLKHEDEILHALKSDLNKSAFEAYQTEVGIVLEEIKCALKHLAGWTRPKRKPTPIMHFPSTSYLYSEPYGCVLIMAPWNYPLQLTMTPLIGAIAAGNCVMIKPSEYSRHTSEIMEKIVKEIFPFSFVSVIKGDRDVNQTLLEEHFDYIFFTGSVTVGKVVMEAAAKHLTPVTLELGGKSPCIVDETADINLAAKRIVWGKLLNSGQTCVAPDYLLVHSSIKERLVCAIKKCIKVFYGDAPEMNPDYPKIINQKHFDRLLNLLHSGHLTTGGQYNEDTLQIAPALLEHVSWNSAIMQEEIFGPLLPIMEFDRLEDAYSMINAHAKPLALYMFTTKRENADTALKTVSFGGGCINDTIIHLSNPNLPFGGVGDSGMGQYHGINSFLTFSHQKSIIRKSNIVDIPFRYPPYKDHIQLLKKLLG
ncbi:aldehyde dehydrogenase [Clostridium sp. C105KSO13]|uniref:aldehyde dehydrogenase n=1 Tax=Clostridium sp. C105KSO13 TaxID=1776045 RepID=UPI0007408019|nr:aldehyde dehydrogenase [Clostridium sp. C105KSO13]CUX44868.1 Aldehyde dehydrogenase [Clostridium sp. C105KSO13]